MNITKFSSLKNGIGGSKTQQLFEVLNLIAIIFPVFIFIFTWRGFVQATVARLMGDRTAQREGFLTLNPFAHVDIVGLGIVIAVFFVIGNIFYSMLPPAVLLIILIVLGVRWTIPIPIDDTEFKHYRLGGIVTSLSGSMGNFLLAFFAVGLMKLTLNPQFPSYVVISLIQIFDTLIYVAIFFGVMDLIPLPPFDGGRLLRYVLPSSLQYIIQWLEEYSLFIFVILFLLPGVSDIFFGMLIFLTMTIKKFMVSIFF